jgi:hypothetical protein
MVQLIGVNVCEDTNIGGVVSMKTTLSTDVDSWILANARHLGDLNSGFADGITWATKTITYTAAEVHIYMPKINITSALKIQWVNKLKQQNPNLNFSIHALEDFIN